MELPAPSPRQGRPYSTEVRFEVARLLAEGEMSIPEIAAQVGISEKTVDTWKKKPEFLALVDVQREDIRKRVLSTGLADRMYRLKHQTDRHKRMMRLLLARANDSTVPSTVAGASTGTLVRTIKQLGSGLNARDVEEYAFDAALMRELAALEKQVAQELGQWDDEASKGSEGAVRSITVKLVSAELAGEHSGS